jgi:hypothetical protein
MTGERPVTFAMPATWPAPSGAAIVARAENAWHNLATLVYHDSLSDGHVTLQTEWKVVAPNRIEYSIANGFGAKIIIGDKAWNQLPHTKRWIESAQLPVQQPVPFWQSAADAHVLGTVSYHGRPAWKVSFFDLEGGPAWFTILVDKASLHTMQLWMTAEDHFMHETYKAFDTPITITPPR